MDHSDIALLSLMAGGDEAALRELMSRYKESVYRFAYRFLQNEADASEVAAETFIRVYRKANDFKPTAKVSTWIFTITSNFCRDYARKAWRRKVFSLFGSPPGSTDEDSPTLEDAIADDKPDAGETTALRDTAAQALRAVEALPSKLKAPFILHVLEDHSQKECAQILGTSEKAVETRIYRARKLIAKAMENA